MMKSTKRNYSRKLRKSKKTMKHRKGAGIMDLFKKKPKDTTTSLPEENLDLVTRDKPNVEITDDLEITTTDEPKKYGSIFSGVKTSAIRSAKAYNMPAILGALSTKINALLIHNKVNYTFSNGYNAQDYDIETVPANGENDGRGILKPNAKRGEITGIQSKIYNISSDKYKGMKKTNTDLQS